VTSAAIKVRDITIKDLGGWVLGGFSIDFGRNFYAFITGTDSFGERVELGNPVNMPMVRVNNNY